jgi:hypothetical protein
MTPRTDRIHLELSVPELQDLASLAHLGFKKMMPNDRIELVRFRGEDQAIAVARAVERLELAMPRSTRTGHAAARQTMIRHWWPWSARLGRGHAPDHALIQQPTFIAGNGALVSAKSIRSRRT